MPQSHKEGGILVLEARKERTWPVDRSLRRCAVWDSRAAKLFKGKLTVSDGTCYGFRTVIGFFNPLIGWKGCRAMEFWTRNVTDYHWLPYPLLLFYRTYIGIGTYVLTTLGVFEDITKHQNNSYYIPCCFVQRCVTMIPTSKLKGFFWLNKSVVSEPAIFLTIIE